LRTSILAAEIMASRRLLSQLNSESTRVGVIAFGEEARLMQPLTHSFSEVRRALDLIYQQGPYGGTNMADAIRLATRELLGKGESGKYLDSIKALIFMTDGFPTRPIGDCTPADTDLAIDAARLAGKEGISVHVFALGEEALSNPRAAVSMAKETDGTYTAVTRPADILAVVDKVSAVGVYSLHVTNETLAQKALRSQLAVDGFFASAVPVVEGTNRIRATARSSDGSIASDTITVHYKPGEMRSLDLEVFLERERSLKLEVERIGKRHDQIQNYIQNQNTDEQSPRPELVGFKSGILDLKGFIWKPSGEGPFPALLWNHGSEKLPGSADRVAPYFVGKGYAFFVPHRRGQGRSPGPYIMDELNQAGSRDERRRAAIDLHERHFEDQLAALQYLQALPDVDRNRVGVMGCSFGGIQTMLALERNPGYRVAVNLSGAAESWRGSSDLRSRLVAAARKATIPVFFVQAENDHDLTPNRVLSEEVRKAGTPVEAKVYPPFGTNPREGHSFCVRGTEIWGPDVLGFIETHLK
jgi:dienelactone hydrolase